MDGPTIISLFHYNPDISHSTLVSSSRKITELLIKLSAENKHRKVFIEGWPTKVNIWKENISAGEKPFPEPFQTAIEIAQHQRWVVEALDRESTLDKLRKFESTQGEFNLANNTFTEKPLKRNVARVPMQYTNSEVRERQWVGTILRRSNPSDIVIVHPQHVQGLTEKLAKKVIVAKVQLLDKPFKQQRLSKAKILAIKKARQRARQKRLKTNRRK